MTASSLSNVSLTSSTQNKFLRVVVQPLLALLPHASTILIHRIQPPATFPGRTLSYCDDSSAIDVITIARRYRSYKPLCSLSGDFHPTSASLPPEAAPLFLLLQVYPCPPPPLPPVPPTVRAPHDSFSLGHSFSNPSRAALLTCDRRDRPFIVSITLAIQSLSLSAFGFGGLDYFTTIPGDSHTTYRHNENPFRDQAPLSSWCSSIPNPLPAL